MQVAPHYWKKKKKSLFGFLNQDLYWVKTPWWIKKLYSGCIWDLPATQKTLYITFDDGPHPEITPFVLDILKQFNARASFFLIGNNAQKYPGLTQRILAEGHAIGNHTMNHVNGWKTQDEVYLDELRQAEPFIPSTLFRPPYGRISRSQIKKINAGLSSTPYKIIMWNLLAGDWVTELSPEKCFEQVKNKLYPGAIVVFHDSEKAWERMRYAFPKLMEWAAAAGYRFESIT